jgi:hypothetical protein
MNLLEIWLASWYLYYSDIRELTVLDCHRQLFRNDSMLLTYILLVMNFFYHYLCYNISLGISTFHSDEIISRLSFLKCHEYRSLQIFKSKTVKVEFTLEEAIKAQTGSRGVALLFL